MAFNFLYFSVTVMLYWKQFPSQFFGLAVAFCFLSIQKNLCMIHQNWKFSCNICKIIHQYYGKENHYLSLTLLKLFDTSESTEFPRAVEQIGIVCLVIIFTYTVMVIEMSKIDLLMIAKKVSHSSSKIFKCFLKMSSFRKLYDNRLYSYPSRDMSVIYRKNYWVLLGR